MRFDFQQALEKAHLTLEETDSSFLLRSKFSWTNKANFGTLLVLIPGFIFLGIAWWIGSQSYMFYIALAPGLVLSLFSLIPIIAQFNNYIEISNTGIVYRNNLIKNSLPKGRGIKLKFSSELLAASANPSASGHKFRIIEFIAKQQNKEFLMMSFQMDEDKAKKATQLGKELFKRMERRVAGFR